MLQNMMRRMVPSKKAKSTLEINVNPDVSLAKWQSYHQEDEEEVVLRKDPKHRKRIVSCPDAADMQLMYKSVDITLLDLKRICEEGEIFLQEGRDSVLSSDKEDKELFQTEDCSEDDCVSTTTLEDLR